MITLFSGRLVITCSSPVEFNHVCPAAFGLKYLVRFLLCDISILLETRVLISL